METLCGQLVLERTKTADGREHRVRMYPLIIGWKRENMSIEWIPESRAKKDPNWNSLPYVEVISWGEKPTIPHSSEVAVEAAGKDPFRKWCGEQHKAKFGKRDRY